MHSLHGAIIPISISFFKAHLWTTAKPRWIEHLDSLPDMSVESTITAPVIMLSLSPSMWNIWKKRAVVFIRNTTEALNKPVSWKIAAGVGEHGVRKQSKTRLPRSTHRVGMSLYFAIWSIMALASSRPHTYTKSGDKGGPDPRRQRAARHRDEEEHLGCHPNVCRGSRLERPHIQFKAVLWLPH